VGPGAVQSFLVDGQGELTPAIANVSSGGSSPPFVAGLSTGETVVVNYSGGNGRIIPTTRDVFFDDATPIITFPSPVNGSSHPHMALEHNGEILVPDLVRFLFYYGPRFLLLVVRVVTLFGDLRETRVLIVTKFRAPFLSLKVVGLDISRYMVRSNNRDYR